MAHKVVPIMDEAFGMVFLLGEVKEVMKEFRQGRNTRSVVTKRIYTCMTEKTDGQNFEIHVPAKVAKKIFFPMTKIIGFVNPRLEIVTRQTAMERVAELVLHVDDFEIV